MSNATIQVWLWDNRPARAARSSWHRLSEVTHNPYEPPRAPRDALDSERQVRRDLRSLAKSQRAIVLCILGNVCLFVVALFASAAGSVLAIVGLVTVGLTIIQLIAVWRLCSIVHGRLIAIAACVGTFVPCLSLVILLVLDGVATKRLKAAGIRVGLLANPDAVP